MVFACVTDHFLNFFEKGGPTTQKFKLTTSEVFESASKLLNNYVKKKLYLEKKTKSLALL